MYKTGLVVGKFYPPHAGHHYIIKEAERQSKKVVVMVCSRLTDLIPAELRAEWLREVHPKAEVRVINDDFLDSNDSMGWANFTKKTLGYTPEAVFTSEAYGDPFAAALGCVHIQVDRLRQHYAISGTALRRDPYANWQYLEPCVRSYYALRIAIVGAESTGKSTLASDLAKEFKSEWVPEYGRTYTELKMNKASKVENITWNSRDFLKIAKEQRHQEELMARSGPHVFFCDTDAFATGIWHERYMGTRDMPTERVDNPSRIALYFLTDVDTPFEQDGLRDGEKIRRWMHERFKARMEAEGRRFLELKGDRQQRLSLAADHVQYMLSQPFDYARANARYGYATYTQI